jgi:hypothetical protein
MQDKAGIGQMIYGRKIVPLLRLRTATQKTAISAGTTLKSFIGGRITLGRNRVCSKLNTSEPLRVSVCRERPLLA